jgi:hypothetical protein
LLTKIIVTKVLEISSEMFIADPARIFVIPDSGSRGQKNTGSRTSNTGKMSRIRTPLSGLPSEKQIYYLNINSDELYGR